VAQTITVTSKGDVFPTSLTKAPNDVLSIKVDFGMFFGSATASTLTVTPDSGLTVGSTSVAANVATVPVSGGDDGYAYDVRVKLAGATETKEIVFQMRVQDQLLVNEHDYGHC
jgi:hypothetical protein